MGLPLARVGHTDLPVPLIGLGTASIGLLYSDVSTTQAIDTIRFALQNGVTFLDTAPYYSQTLVEQRIGQALAGIPRDSYVLATKVGRPDGTDEMDFSADGVKRSIEGSLRRLHTDRIDILHIHDPNRETYRAALNEAYPILADLRARGAIRAVGVGMNYPEILDDFMRDAEFDCFLLAGRYTLLEQGALGLLNRCGERGISIFAAGVYNSGILAKGAISGAWYQYAEAPPEIKAKVRRLESVCERYEVPLHSAAFQFVKAHPAVASLIIGAESTQQLAQTLEGSGVSIPHEFWASLRAEGLLDPQAPLPIQPYR
jgi:D-threo-aldose 1-dehydrogenase